MKVTVRPELESFVNELVASGRYVCPDEVVHIALLFLKDQEDLRKIHVEELRREIAVGLEQANRGELLDGEDVFARLQERIRKDSGQGT